jgi:hypothetical protein
LSTALHEAAHAIVAKELGYTGIRAQLGDIGDRPGRPTAGAVSHNELRGCRDDLEALRRDLAVTIAGPIAVHMAEGKNPLGPAKHDEIARRCLDKERAPHARHDGTWPSDARQWVIEQLAEEYRDEVLAYEVLDIIGGHALREAVRIIRDRWDEIEDLATRLEQAGGAPIEVVPEAPRVTRSAATATDRDRARPAGRVIGPVRASILRQAAAEAKLARYPSRKAPWWLRVHSKGEIR